MRNLSEIAKLLGEENEKRLKDAFTDLLIGRIQEDLECLEDYVLDYSLIFDEISRDVREYMKESLMDVYMKKADEKLSELFLVVSPKTKTEE